MPRNPIILILLALTAIVVIFLLKSQLNTTSTEPDQSVTGENKAPSESAQNPARPYGKTQYTGRESCANCHAEQYQAWRNSHHDLAMQEATDATVLGDFNDAKFSYYEVTSRFYKKDGKFYVNTDNAQGQMQDFEIKYTFGVIPLQQYLIEFPGGRLQALNVVWDTRAKAQGGQRWFHLYPNENVNHQDPLHWTGPFQNWNYMCAECHSTNLKKNYDLEHDTFNTTWSEIDVSCEACHGPASNHVMWAQAAARSDTQEYGTNKGFDVSLSDPAKGRWILAQDQRHAVRSAPTSSDRVIQTCARCHSRRSVLDDDYRHGANLMDTHLPALLTPALYYPDGQIKDEVYVYGSFLQSKMHKAGVVCNDCHDPHSLQLKAQANALCTRCHNAEVFDTQTHHHHDKESPGARCVSCHMPTTLYMVVDPRADHSFRVPRPDLSDELGAPNACIKCHTHKSNNWASEAVAKWTGPRDRPKHYGQIINAGRLVKPQADVELTQLALDKNQAAIVRATAISLLANYPYARTTEMLDDVYLNSDPLIRYAVTDYLPLLVPPQRTKYAGALLTDPVRAVRINAARVLMDTPADLLSGPQRQSVQHDLEEYLATLRFNADRPEGLTNLGNYYQTLGDISNAETYFKSAIKTGPALAQAYVNLADMYRTQQREHDAEDILRLGLKQSANTAPIHFALGLNLVRQQRMEEALKELEQAAELAQDQAHYAYVYGVALQSTKGYATAIKYLEKAAKRHPGDADILFAMASFSLQSGDRAAAQHYADSALILAPQHPGAQQLQEELSRQ